MDVLLRYSVLRTFTVTVAYISRSW